MTSFRLRQLGAEDMVNAALVHRTSLDERLPLLAGLHTPEEDRGFYRDQVYPKCTLWGAIQRDGLVGIIAFRQDWIDQLYVLPDIQGCGIGSTLLNVAKAQSERLSLWTFQRNTVARQFYERRGFSMIRETDGAGNEEHEPDVLYQWAASEPAHR